MAYPLRREDCWDIRKEPTLNHLEPAPKTKGSPLSPTQPSLENGARDRQGIRGMPEDPLSLFSRQSPDNMQKHRRMTSRRLLPLPTPKLLANRTNLLIRLSPDHGGTSKTSAGLTMTVIQFLSSSRKASLTLTPLHLHGLRSTNTAITEQKGTY
jgi:hypothetical protein